MNGKGFTWTNHREGRRSLAFQGNREVDIYALFFDQDAYDKYKLSKDEYALLKEKEDKMKTDKPTLDSTAKKAGEKRGRQPSWRASERRNNQRG